MRYTAHIRVILSVPNLKEARFIVDWIRDSIKKHWRTVQEVTANIEGTNNGNVESKHE